MASLHVYALLFTLTFGLINVSVGQTQSSEQQLEKYLLDLKALKVDTILIIKSGCVGCQVKYDDNKLIPDAQTVYVATRRLGQFEIMSFDDLNRQKHYVLSSFSLFDAIHQYKIILQEKGTFHKKELTKLETLKFNEPAPAHYSYQDIEIRVADFHYTFELIENRFNYKDFAKEREQWFTVMKMIIDNFFSILHSIEK